MRSTVHNFVWNKRIVSSSFIQNSFCPPINTHFFQVRIFLKLIFLSRTWGWEYLSFRLCTGIWIGIILLFLVATDASAYVCYITRFTEENFATLIAFIFIKKVKLFCDVSKLD